MTEMKERMEAMFASLARACGGKAQIGSQIFAHALVGLVRAGEISESKIDGPGGAIAELAGLQAEQWTEWDEEAVSFFVSDLRLQFREYYANPNSG